MKTAFFASDPNLGRIVSAIGNAGIANLDPVRVSFWLDDVHVVERGARWVGGVGRPQVQRGRRGCHPTVEEVPHIEELRGYLAAAVGTLMNTRGLTELIVLNIGLDLGLVSHALFTMLVLMALVTTFMAGPLLSRIEPAAKHALVCVRPAQTTFIQHCPGTGGFPAFDVARRP